MHLHGNKLTEKKLNACADSHELRPTRSNFSNKNVLYHHKTDFF